MHPDSTNPIPRQLIFFIVSYIINVGYTPDVSGLRATGCINNIGYAVKILCEKMCVSVPISLM